MLNISPAKMSIAALTAEMLTTSIHHIFRLGAELIIPAAIGTILPIVLWVLFARLQKPILLWLYGLYAGLVVFWFGLLDGFLDHAVKAAGLPNLTFLPRSEAETVITAMSLWSQEASAAFYEGTGILSAALALATLLTTSHFIFAESTTGSNAAA